jgi:hypothetical protein
MSAAGSVDASTPSVPPPPPGPGVAPPFAAPPIEGRNVRIWIGLGVAGLAALLCCGGGTAAFVGLILTSTEALNEQARTVVGDYLDALKEEEYAEAYRLLCDEAQDDESQGEFADRVSREPDIVSYTLHDMLIADFTLEADVRYAGGSGDSLRFVLVQDQRTGELEVCGIDG